MSSGLGDDRLAPVVEKSVRLNDEPIDTHVRQAFERRARIMLVARLQHAKWWGG